MSRSNFTVRSIRTACPSSVGADSGLVGFTRQRSSQISRQRKEEAHEMALVGRIEEEQQELRTVGLFPPIPPPRASVDNGRVVKNHQGHQHDPQVIHGVASVGGHGLMLFRSSSLGKPMKSWSDVHFRRGRRGPRRLQIPLPAFRTCTKVFGVTLELKEATKRYGACVALDRCSIELRPGEVVCLLGENGAGKSTLLRALAGLVALDSGDTLLDGTSLRRENLAQRRQLFFVPDFPPLLWDETVVRNVSTLVGLYQADRPGLSSRIVELLEAFDLLDKAEAEAVTLSRGQLYKTTLTALLAIDPPFWLLDEPLASGVDPIGLRVFRHEARAAASRGHCVIFTTQIVEIAESLADRVAILHRGQLRALESVSSLRQGSASGDSALHQLLQRLTCG